MRKAVAAITGVVALVLMSAIGSAPAAVADGPILITDVSATPSTLELQAGANGVIDFAATVTPGLNPVAGVSAVLGPITTPMTSTGGDAYTGSMTVPWNTKPGLYVAKIWASGGDEVEFSPVDVHVLGPTRITMWLDPAQPQAGGNYTVWGKVERPSETTLGAYVPAGAALTLDGAGQHLVFTVGATGVFHHAVTHAVATTWTTTFAGDSAHTPATASVAATALHSNPTRIVSYDAGPEPAYTGGSITVHGYLQRYSPTLRRWIAYGGQVVTISRSSVAVHVVTSSTGYFSASLRGANVVESGVWHAAFAGYSSGGTVVNAPTLTGDAVATVTAPLRITRVYYNPPGADTLTTAQLNREYVVITNAGSRTANLYRWVLRDSPVNHAYEFGGNIYLAPGRSVVVHTGKGTNGAGHYYWGLGNYVWNNTGDTAVIQAYPTNVAVDSCSWGNGVGYTSC